MRRRKPAASQKITLANDGIVVPKRMQSAGAAISPPSVRLSRLRNLIKTQLPKVCIVRGEGIGDVITTTPTVQAIRHQFQKIHLTYATNTRYLGGALVEVLKYNPDIDQIIERELLDESDFDLVVNLHCPCIHYEKRGNPPISRIDLFAKHAGVKLISPVPRFFIQEEEVSAGEALMGPLMNEKTILVQPSASSTRRSIDHRTIKTALASLYKNFGIRSIILTHSTDWATDVLWENIPGAALFKDLKIREIAGVMVHCDLTLCPDSSVMHLAAALGAPAVALLGPSHPKARVGHYKNIDSVWGGEGLAPCPCWYGSCPINTACWSAITPDRIVAACIERLNKTSKLDVSSLSYRDNSLVVETEIL